MLPVPLPEFLSGLAYLQAAHLTASYVGGGIGAFFGLAIVIANVSEFRREKTPRNASWGTSR